MNKSKLVRIIVKDLEELKMLSEEVVLAQDSATLIADLAVSKARLLCQEIELLRELSGSSDSLTEDEESDLVDEEENEVSDVSVADPELEIINFEEREFPEEETIENQDEQIEENEDEYSEGEPENDEEEGIAEENEEENLNIEEAESNDEDNQNAEEGDDLTEEEEDVKEEEEEEDNETQPATNIQYTELKNEFQPEIREIQIEDMDDDDIESVKFSTQSVTGERPAMHEISKPERPVHEKVVVGESFQKERSLNDVIGDNKQDETTLTNGSIASLRAAIGLNDRFLFIREIFNNNSDKYNTIIDHLDKLETIQEAVEYLKANLTLQKNETSMKFVDLLKRRFSK